MDKVTLVIMAAGIGSRFGGGIKQLEPVGPNGEIIIDYSINDALEAGFNKIIFVIRKDLEKEFREIIGDRIGEKVEIHYVFQEINDIPLKYQQKFLNRSKPWGTGQAVLCCKNKVKEPFLVINADDYYGKEAYKIAYNYLVNEQVIHSKLCMCMVGFLLKNTLSDNGGVTRGICEVNNEGVLTDIKETHNIVKVNGGAGILDENSFIQVNAESIVSMNMWGFTPELFSELEKRFEIFLENTDVEDEGCEYLLPIIIGNLIKEQRACVKVLETRDKWFGVTYKEDRTLVIEAIKEMIKDEGKQVN